MKSATSITHQLYFSPKEYPSQTKHIRRIDRHSNLIVDMHQSAIFMKNSLLSLIVEEKTIKKKKFNYTDGLSEFQIRNLLGDIKKIKSKIFLSNIKLYKLLHKNMILFRKPCMQKIIKNFHCKKGEVSREMIWVQIGRCR